MRVYGLWVDMSKSFFLKHGCFGCVADLSGEHALVQRVAELRERLHHAEMLNQQRLQDVMVLSQKFNAILQPGKLFVCHY